MNKKITIITCTYNSWKYLKQCLESILSQKVKSDDYEHIIIDGNSTDNTDDIIKDYIHNSSCKNIQYIKKKPKWVYNAMNEGIKIANWSYICFVNSDDFFESWALAHFFKNIEKYKNIDVFHGDLQFINGINSYSTNTAKLYKLRFFLANLWFHCLLLFPSMLIKRSVFDLLWLFDETKTVSSDFGFWLKIFKNNLRIKFIPEVIANFRIHQESISSWKYQELWKQEMKQFRTEYLWFQWKIINWISSCINLVTWKYM